MTYNGKKVDCGAFENFPAGIYYINNFESVSRRSAFQYHTIFLMIITSEHKYLKKCLGDSASFFLPKVILKKITKGCSFLLLRFSDIKILVTFCFL